MDGEQTLLGNNLLVLIYNICKKLFCQVWVGTRVGDDFRPILISDG
jgi:hypothetical protein